MALTSEDLQAIGALIDNKINPIAERMDRMEEDISSIKNDVAVLKEDVAILKEDMAQVKEDTEITRSATNSLVEWAETVGVITQVKFPIKKVNNG